MHEKTRKKNKHRERERKREDCGCLQLDLNEVYLYSEVLWLRYKEYLFASEIYSSMTNKNGGADVFRDFSMRSLHFHFVASILPFIHWHFPITWQEMRFASFPNCER